MSDNGIIKCQAWDLLGTYHHYWFADGYRIKTSHGRVLWTDAAISWRSQKIVLQRLDTDSLRCLIRRIDYDTPVFLIPRSE